MNQNVENSMDQNNLMVSRKAVSISLAIVIALAVFCFIAGFFWGYRQASTEVQANINQTGFIDQINHAANTNKIISAAVADAPVVVVSQSTDATIDPADAIVSKLEPVETSENIPDQKYYAELIGFGHLKTAQAFVDKMQKKGYPIVMRKRSSKSGNGKVINWYQAITENFEDRDKLTTLIEMIKKTEHLQDIKIKKLR